MLLVIQCFELSLCVHLQHLIDFTGSHGHLLAVVLGARQLVQGVKVLVLVAHAQLAKVASTFGIVDPFYLHKFEDTLTD